MPLGCLLAARVDKKPLMCALGMPVGCQSGHKKPLMCGLAVPIRSHSCVASGWP